MPSFTTRSSCADATRRERICVERGAGGLAHSGAHMHADGDVAELQGAHGLRVDKQPERARRFRLRAGHRRQRRRRHMLLKLVCGMPVSRIMWTSRTTVVSGIGCGGTAERGQQASRLALLARRTAARATHPCPSRGCRSRRRVAQGARRLVRQRCAHRQPHLTHARACQLSGWRCSSAHPKTNVALGYVFIFLMASSFSPFSVSTNSASCTPRRSLWAAAATAQPGAPLASPCTRRCAGP
jgi:hypothetical protein